MVGFNIVVQDYQRLISAKKAIVSFWNLKVEFKERVEKLHLTDSQKRSPAVNCSSIVMQHCSILQQWPCSSIWQLHHGHGRDHYCQIQIRVVGIPRHQIISNYLIVSGYTDPCHNATMPQCLRILWYNELVSDINIVTLLLTRVRTGC